VKKVELLHAENQVPIKAFACDLQYFAENGWYQIEPVDVPVEIVDSEENV
jgi:hypothetical protein